MRNPNARHTMKLSPEESLLFLTCLAYPDDEGDHSIGRLVRLPLNWEQIVWRSEHCRTTPLLWYHLCRLGLQETVPDHIRHYLSCWTALSSRRSESLYGELIHIIQAFDQAGIAYYTFKGTALSALFYPNPLIRPMLDLDFMVVPDQVPAAREVMVRLGYLHAFWDSDTNAIKPLMPNQIAQYQNEHYELPIFMKLVRAESPV